MREDPSDDLTLPSGLLLVAQEKDSVLGCAGLRLLPGHAAEVTRVFVIPAARRRGLGSRLLDCLEGHARHHRVTTLRLGHPPRPHRSAGDCTLATATGK